MRLEPSLVRAETLTLPQRDAMFALMDEHYLGVHRPRFERDLAEKRWAILVQEPNSGRLCGFSTQVVIDIEVQGKPVKALFSGDTIVHRDWWGDPALSHAWGRFALDLVKAHAQDEFYWFLLSKGFRTYRFLPVFFHEFYPRHDAATPARVQAVIEALAHARYPGEYDASAGVIRALSPRDRLRDGLVEIPSGRLHDPHVRFFLDRNPGHVRGDELCCLAPLTRANFTLAALRVIGSEPVLGPST